MKERKSNKHTKIKWINKIENSYPELGCTADSNGMLCTDSDWPVVEESWSGRRHKTVLVYNSLWFIFDRW